MQIFVETHFKPSFKLLLRDAVNTTDKLVFKDELTGEAEELKALSEAEIILGNPKPAQKLLQATRLKWIQLASTGFEIYTGIKIPALATNLKDFYAVPCAETMIAGIMSLYRGMDRFSLLKEKQQWLGVSLREGLRLLTHKNVIILGAGSIGKQTAKLLTGFDCTIRFFARTSPEAGLRNARQLEGALTQADLVIGCLPGTPETKGLFTRKMITLMKPDALFCNVGRGNLLEDESALVDALMNEKIGGAVLDVTMQEPLPADHALWKCPNTIISQHTGGGYIDERKEMIRFFLKNLRAFKEGKPMENLIKMETGY